MNILNKPLVCVCLKSTGEKIICWLIKKTKNNSLFCFYSNNYGSFSLSGSDIESISYIS